MTALCWICNDKVWKQYVQHRVDEIRRHSDKEAWRYCLGWLSPTDLLSRGITAAELIEQMLWWQDPDFLRESTLSWPSIDIGNLNQEAQLEMVKNIPAITLSPAPALCASLLRSLLITRTTTV